ncbi:type III polyketide synthase [Bacillus spizizenii]|uniref:Type III polyketide synthase n=1 Tax=Bacillus spizizenii TaxID=96241 RepID=A0A9Q4E2H1_BACSC|nr:type III polyketide synthase [Bacillus spizizenii]MCY8456337.1 type III polyketide synthase [Bacillus spizizenii]
MAFILSIGTSLPAYDVNQERATEFARYMFQHSFKDIDRLLTSFKNGQIHSRQFVKPIEWYKEGHSFEEKNQIYIEETLKHSSEAVRECLSHPEFFQEAIPYEKVDAVFFVSSTGLSTPSIDARLMNELPFSPYTKRIPLWGLGCAGGASGLARAAEYCKAYPEAFVLVIAAELCSLTFQPEDKTKSNLIGTSLFGDGIAAALLCGEKADRRISKLKLVPKITDSQSVLMKQSEDVMGWDFTDQGFKVIFSRDIPTLVEKWLKTNVQVFLDKHQLSFSDISVFLAHPGGKKVIDAYIKSLELSSEKLLSAQSILQMHGNMSSATILYVIKEHLLNGHKKEAERGLIGALGPGFSSELLLFSWERGLDSCFGC